MTAATGRTSPDGISQRGWTLALVLAIGLHVAPIALLLIERPDLPVEETAGYTIVELAPMVTSAAAATQSTTPGPESVDSVASQAQAEAKPPEVLDQEVPVAEPSPTTPEPELAVPKQVERKEVVEREPETQQPEAVAVAAAVLSAASQAMAPQRIEAPEAAKSAAPVIGSSPKAVRARMTWHQSIVAHLNRFKHFPSSAPPHVAHGEVLVQFTLDRSGKVLSSGIVQGSGVTALDGEATSLLSRASPLPRPSVDVAGETFSLTVPIIFKRS